MPRALPGRLLTRRPYICTACAQSLRKPFSTTPLNRQQQQQQSILHLLEERGLINQIAGDRSALSTLLERRKVGFYAGIDPTAPSLHLGHLLPCMVLFWLWHRGHHVVSLIGGATAKVGDPSGRLTSRVEAGEDVIQRNYERMSVQVEGLWGSVGRYGERWGLRKQQDGNGNGRGLGRREVLNNADWLEGLNVLKFLKMMGHGARLGAMLSRDTVRNKMDKGDGMSFAEFTYPLLQAWDWWQLYEDRGVQIQVGGGDQYGNIIAGIDAVKSIAQSHAHGAAAAAAAAKTWLDKDGRLKDEHAPMGLTVPLLTTSSGEKFGKSAGNAIWLDATMTSPFDLYGFLLRSADADVERYLKIFTFVPLDDIRRTMEAQRADPGKRPAQHLLASEVLELVHGADVARSTRAEHEAARSPALLLLSAEDGEQNDASSSTAAARIKLPQSLILNTPFARILYHAGLVATKSEGARMVSTGGVYVALQSSAATNTDGGEQQLKFVPLTKELSAADVLKNGVMVLRLGKWKVRVVEVLDDGAFEASGSQAPPGWEEWKAGK